MRILGLLIVVWLIIGVVAAGQRGYFGKENPNCSRAGKIAVTVVAGPLNYVGVNPKTSCLIPKPSS